MPLDLETRVYLSSCDQRGEKDDRRSLQFRIGLDLFRYFASVSLWHHYVEQDQIRPENPGTLMSLGGVVLFEHKIAADLFEKDFDHMGAVPVVINNQDASLFSDRRPRHTKASWAGTLAAVSHLFRNPKLASNILKRSGQRKFARIILVPPQ